MPRPRKPDPEKFCERCGTQFFRATYAGGDLEPHVNFRKRRYCSLHCANSRGNWGASSTARHRESQKYCKEACERCGRPESLHVHHKDENMHNNDPLNLETLCASCHKKWHLSRERSLR